MALRCIVLILRPSGKNEVLTSEEKKKKVFRLAAITVDVALRLIYQLNNLLGGSKAMNVCGVKTVKQSMLMFNF